MEITFIKNYEVFGCCECSGTQRRLNEETVFYVVTSCSRRFGNTHCLHHQGDHRLYDAVLKCIHV